MVTALVVTIAACSGDDDEKSSDETGLVGTWTITSVDDEEIPFSTISFTKDGKVTVADIKSDPKEDDPWEPWTYSHYTVNGNSLRIDVGEGHADDSLIGTFTITGNNATYTYHWGDYDGKWESNDIHIMSLRKK